MKIEKKKKKEKVRKKIRKFLRKQNEKVIKIITESNIYIREKSIKSC